MSVVTPTLFKMPKQTQGILTVYSQADLNSSCTIPGTYVTLDDVAPFKHMRRKVEQRLETTTFITTFRIDKVCQCSTIFFKTKTKTRVIRKLHRMATFIA